MFIFVTCYLKLIFLEIVKNISHKLIAAVPITTIDNFDTIAFICDDVTDAKNEADTIYYLNNQEFVTLNISYVDVSKITTTQIDGATYTISFPSVTGNVFISMPSPSVYNNSITLVTVNNGNKDLSTSNFWHTKDNFIHIFDFQVTFFFQLEF
jgi:hypothetical protein